MTAQILQFKKIPPKKSVIGHRLSFYLEEEIDVVLIALNMYGNSVLRYNANTLTAVDPIFIKHCLILLKGSNICSSETKKMINIIIGNIKEITAIAK